MQDTESIILSIAPLRYYITNVRCVSTWTVCPFVRYKIGVWSCSVCPFWFCSFSSCSSFGLVMVYGDVAVRPFPSPLHGTFCDTDSSSTFPVSPCIAVPLWSVWMLSIPRNHADSFPSHHFPIWISLEFHFQSLSTSYPIPPFDRGTNVYVAGWGITHWSAVWKWLSLRFCPFFELSMLTFSHFHCGSLWVPALWINNGIDQLVGIRDSAMVSNDDSWYKQIE